MTQQELADCTTLSATMIAHVETNRKWVSNETIALLAHHLRVKPVELFADPEHVAQPTISQSLAVISGALETMRAIEEKAPGLLAQIASKLNVENASYVQRFFEDLDDPTPVNGIRTEAQDKGRRRLKSAVD